MGGTRVLAGRTWPVEAPGVHWVEVHPPPLLPPAPALLWHRAPSHTRDLCHGLAVNPRKFWLNIYTACLLARMASALETVCMGFNSLHEPNEINKPLHCIANSWLFESSRKVGMKIDGRRNPVNMHPCFSRSAAIFQPPERGRSAPVTIMGSPW